MILPARSTAAFAEPRGTTFCAECGAAASGNFCSACGADLRAGAAGMLGAIAGPVRQSFPAVYLKLLRSPIKTVVALAEDPTYRGHVSFLLAALAIYCLLFLPIILQMAVPGGESAQISPSLRTLMKILAQVGLYVGVAITFALGYALFRFFAKEPRPLQGYFKLYCLAWGFIAPIYAVYEYVARTLLGGTGMSSFNGPMMPEQWATPSAALAVVLALTLLAYFLAIHRRFWRMPLWKTVPLYLVAAITSNKLGYWLMFYVGYWTAYLLAAYGIVHA